MMTFAVTGSCFSITIFLSFLSEQKAEAAKKIVVNILPVDSTGTQQPCDEGRVDFHRMKLALKADAQNQWLGLASHTNHVDERHYKSWRTKAKQAN